MVATDEGAHTEEEYRRALERVLPSELANRQRVIDGAARHLAAVADVNRRLNLTRIVDPDEAAVKHVFDSLLGAKHLPQGAKVVDLGSGAGFPGVPLHFAREDLQLTLCESKQKKAAFLREFLESEALDIEVAGRAEEWLRRHRGVTVLARAVGSVSSLLEVLGRVPRSWRRAVLWKGPAVFEELESARAVLTRRRIHVHVSDEILLPHEFGRRHLVLLSQSHDSRR